MFCDQLRWPAVPPHNNWQDESKKTNVHPVHHFGTAPVTNGVVDWTFVMVSVCWSTGERITSYLPDYCKPYTTLPPWNGGIFRPTGYTGRRAKAKWLSGPNFCGPWRFCFRLDMGKLTFVLKYLVMLGGEGRIHDPKTHVMPSSPFCKVAPLGTRSIPYQVWLLGGFSLLITCVVCFEMKQVDSTPNREED